MKKNYIFVLLLFVIGQTISAQSAQKQVQQFMASIVGQANIKATDVAEWTITDIVPSSNPAIQHIYVQQYYRGIPVENGRYKITLKNGQVSWSINKLITDIEDKAKELESSLSVDEAITKVAKNHNITMPSMSKMVSVNTNSFILEDSRSSLEPIKADKVYIEIDGKLRIGWKVNFYELDGKHWWNDVIDAETGEVLISDDWVVQCNFGDSSHNNHMHNESNLVQETVIHSTILEQASTVTAVGGGSYNVYPLGIESPNHGNRAIVSDAAVASASPFGWHDTNGQPGAEFTTTRGNNVVAQDDTNGNNGNGTLPDGGSNLDFNFSLNLNNAPSTFLPAATTNLFYWNNIMHDVWYQYGFNEASGNFQENNYGNGGSGSDAVFADAQDGSGTNNANFSTPPDGRNPRMQMFLWTNPTRDGSFDNVVIAHEYGHGISTRLVGGPNTNALGGSEQMGEGWSDWFGLVMTIRPGDTRTTSRGVGTYAIGQNTNGSGIRATPYNTNFSVNATTYDDIGSLRAPHGVGYGFATILWDMTWDLIDQEGYDGDLYNGTGGNNIAMALVIEGLKNTSGNPGYVSGRDGILQADQDLYGGRYNCLIWDAFANRGVGVDAAENINGGTNTNTDQITSFTSGCSATPPPTSCDVTINNFPYTESFESGLGGWEQATGDDFDWSRNSGGTRSSNTGPSVADDGTFYIYAEASNPNNPNKTLILNSPCFDLSNQNNANLSFSYHMDGSQMGTLNLDVSDDEGATWTTEFSQSGDQGGNWLTANVDLSSYSGDTVQIRFAGETGSGFRSDMAVDDIAISGGTTSSTFPDPNKTYYIDAPIHNLRIAASGSSQDAYTTSTNTTGADVEWKFVDKGNGSWHIDRAAGGSVPRLRSDNSINADMQATTSSGTFTYYDLSQGAISGTHFLTLPNGPGDFVRLQINRNGEVRMVPSSFSGTWESLLITEVPASAITSTQLTTSVDSIDLSLEEEKIMVFPNPVVTMLQVQLPSEGEEVVLSLVSFSGTTVRKNTFNTNNGINVLEVNTADLVPGVYILYIQRNGTRVTRKILIE